jgi:hypothetical protein
LFFIFGDSKDLGYEKFPSKDMRNLFKADPAKLGRNSVLHKEKELKIS